MALVHFNSWSNIDALQHQLNRLLDDVVIPMTGDDIDGGTFSPATELYDREDALVLLIELPGIQPDELDIEVTEDTVLIKGDRTPVMNHEETKPIRTEFRYGTFRRMFKLPTRVKNTAAKAEYKNGILHLTLPKTDAEKNRVVKVNIAASN
jgi:HSP20 family protein